MPSGLNLRQKDISVGNGINIEYSTTGSGITLSIPPMEDRLLPTGGKDGDILGYQEGVDRGNNTDTKLLIQPATSDGLIVDQATGNAAPVSITNSGNVVIEDNALVFTGTNSLLIPANALGMTLGGNNEFMIDIEFQLDSVKSDYATLYGSDGGGDGYQGALYFTSGGAAQFTMDLGPRTTGWTLGTKHRITIERWNDNGTWKTSVYRNGSFLASSTSGMNILSNYVFPIGSNNESTNRNFIGKIWAFRISNKAEHHGVSFAPQELPFLPPAGQPVWTEGIDRSRLLPENPANGDIPCFDATATIGGGNNENTKILLHFDTEIKDEAAGNAAPVTIITKSGTITLVDGGKFGKCAKFVTGSMTIATNLDELNANNWVVSGWFNPDADKHGVSYPTWLSMDDQNTHGFGFDSTGRYGESDAPLFYMDTPPTAGEWHWLAIVKYSGGLRFYLNGAFLNEIVSSQMANFCSTLAIGGFAGTYAAGSTERTFSGLVDEVRLQYIPEDEISKWTGTSIAVPTEPYTVKQIVGEWNTINKTSLVNSINGITPDDTGNVTLDLLTEEQLSKLNSIVLANDFTFTQSDIVSNMITKNATTLGVPAGSMVQVLSNTGIVMTERAGILVYWSGNNLIIDFTGYFNTTQTTLTGTWTVKFAGNFVGKSQSVPGGASSLDEISGKPSAFPPSAHTHAQADVAGLEDALQNVGTVKSVNGQLPDESGNVTIETGGGSDVNESRLLPDAGPDDSWMHHSESMDLVTPTDMTSMQSADWTLTAENVQENFSNKPWGLFDSGSYGFCGSGPATCTWTRRDGTPTLIDRLKIYTGSPGNNNGDSYEFYGSQDGNNWTLLGSWSANWNSDSVKDTETNLNVLTLEVSNSTKYLHYKFSANSPTLKCLKGYGVTTKNEWKKLPTATASAAGLMAAADKAKLDSLNIMESMANPGYFKLPNGTIVQYGGQHVSGSTNTIQLPITVATISYQHVSVWGDNSDLEALDALPMVVLVEPGGSPISSLTAVTKTANDSTWGGYITWLVIGTV